METIKSIAASLDNNLLFYLGDEDFREAQYLLEKGKSPKEIKDIMVKWAKSYEAEDMAELAFNRRYGM